MKKEKILFFITSATMEAKGCDTCSYFSFLHLYFFSEFKNPVCHFISHFPRIPLYTEDCDNIRRNQVHILLQNDPEL